jgi:hypothetical protein
VNDLLKNSVMQRRDFVDELENKLKGLRGEEVTPKFMGDKKEVGAFSFEMEIEKLKKTLEDIKDQEKRFIKLLSRQKSPQLEQKSKLEL